MAAGGIGVTASTGGVAILVGSPALVVGGTTMAAHGSTVINTALTNLAKANTLNSSQISGGSKPQSGDKAIRNSTGEPVKQMPKVEPKNNGGKQPKGNSVINSNGEGVKQGDKVKSKQKAIPVEKPSRKGGGKNAPHANQKKREAAKEDYEKAKEEYEEFKKHSGLIKNRKKELQRLKDKMKHFKQELDFIGETHSRNAKGNK